MAAIWRAAQPPLLEGIGLSCYTSSHTNTLDPQDVKNDFRKQGVGQSILLQLEKKAREQGIKAIVLDAREHAVGFYIKNGYKVTGSSYLLFGEIPHSKMEKQIEGSA